jgi:hypothetical protein
MQDVLLIDEITSISNGYFGFKYKGAFLSKSPFIVNKRNTSQETSAYHFGWQELKMIHKAFPNIYPKSYSSKEWNASLTPQSYMEVMRYRFFLHIRNGSMVQIMAYLTGDSTPDYEITWDGPRTYKLPTPKFEK